MDKETQEFCQKYDAVAGPSHRVHHRVRRLSYEMWSESDPDIINTIPYEHIKCVEIHMPEDRFRALIEHDHWLEFNQQAHEGFQGRDALRIAREREHECRIRHENPAVQKAWERYQMLLNTVKDHYK